MAFPGFPRHNGSDSESNSNSSQMLEAGSLLVHLASGASTEQHQLQQPAHQQPVLLSSLFTPVYGSQNSDIPPVTSQDITTDAISPTSRTDLGHKNLGKKL